MLRKRRQPQEEPRAPKGKIFIRVNEFKSSEKHPDYRGTIQIPIEMLQEISEENCTEYKGVTYAVFSYGIWEGDDDYSMGTVEIQQPKSAAKSKQSQYKGAKFAGGSRGKAQESVEDPTDPEFPF